MQKTGGGDHLVLRSDPSLRELNLVEAHCSVSLLHNNKLAETRGWMRD